MDVKKYTLYILILLVTHSLAWHKKVKATEFTESSFLIAGINSSNISRQDIWKFIETNRYSGFEVGAKQKDRDIYLSGQGQNFSIIINKLSAIVQGDPSRVIPVFINYEGDISLLDSIITKSKISPLIFYLPRGEAWPSLEYLVQANKRIILFVSGRFEMSSQVLHQTEGYILDLSALNTTVPKPSLTNDNYLNLELLMIDKFNTLPVNAPPGSDSRNMVPDYINFLLESWTRYGKKPNFIFIDDEVSKFNFIISQLNSFTWIKGTARTSGKILEKVYWKNPETAVTGGRFSFPYRGGEELTLTPFAPGYKIIPEQIIVTGEMEVPENYNIMASPLKLSEGLTGSFNFNKSISDALSLYSDFSGKNYSFSQDIERGTVLKLPENSSINLGPSDNYELRNNSFSVSCFVKFNEILEFGDNAVLGNYENEYRRGLHLILRSGHPYFGLWANDYISEEKLEPNIWYHLVWRYIIETGEQAIFLNGKNIGSSKGHPPFSGTGDIHLGSALSQGASLRGYIDDLHFWNRPLGIEEINRIALDEEISPGEEKTYIIFFKEHGYKALIALLLISIIATITLLLVRKSGSKKTNIDIVLPSKDAANQINLYGEFRAINDDGENITSLFTPKVKELFLFTLFTTLKNEAGASVSEINKYLWPGLPLKKVNNNRAVTLNKLRKILDSIEGLEIITLNGFLKSTLKEPFFCDYTETYKLCREPAGLNKQQLEKFFLLVNRGRFLKDMHWPWLDEILGFTGNQVIDNLLKLASLYIDRRNISKIDALAKRILEYDDLNEEATWLKVWSLLETGNQNLAKFQFESFSSKYQETLGEPYPMNFNQFNRHYSELL